MRRYRATGFAMSGLLVLLLLGCTNHIARRQAYLDANPNLPDSTRANIMIGKIWLGMSREQLIASIGEPNRVEKRLSSALDIDASNVATTPPLRGLDWSMKPGLEPRAFAASDDLAMTDLLIYEQSQTTLEVECQYGWVTAFRETPRINLYNPIYRIEPPPMPTLKR